MVQVIYVSSIQSPNADPICREIAGYLEGQLGIQVLFVEDLPWQDRDYDTIREMAQEAELVTW